MARQTAAAPIRPTPQAANHKGSEIPSVSTEATQLTMTVDALSTIVTQAQARRRRDRRAAVLRGRAVQMAGTPLAIAELVGLVGSAASDPRTTERVTRRNQSLNLSISSE